MMTTTLHWSPLVSKIMILKKVTLATALLGFIGCTKPPSAPPTGGVSVDNSDTTEITVGDVVTELDKTGIKGVQAMKEQVDVPTEYNALTDFEEYVILQKGTERAFVGEYTDLDDAGTYICRQCNAALYRSDHKFHSDCGWPAFDDEIAGAVDRHADADGYRVEIVCHNCGGHLGHVFAGERLTEKNIRHCVNSVSMKFMPKARNLPPVITKLTTE